MRPLRLFLDPLLAGRPLESGPASALSAAIWVFRRRLDEMNETVWQKADTEVFESLFQRRLQLIEDIEALEALLRRAEGKRPFEPTGPTPPSAGHGYGEV